MIEPILKLITIIMVIDNETDEDELALLQKAPVLMAEHLEDRAGVNVVITVGGSSKTISQTKNELDEASECNLSDKDISKIANKTIKEYNDIDENEKTAWLCKIADEINGKWVRFHSLKLLVDMAYADKKTKKEELGLISKIASHWGLIDDALDFLFLKTRTEWIYKNGNLTSTNKKTRYF